MQYAIYARFSNEKQNEKSVVDQIRECRNYIEKNDGNLSDRHIFSDEAVSGSHLITRPGINDLMMHAKRNEFDVVICDDMSRLSRDQEDMAGLFKRLSYLDIKILSLLEGEVNEMHIGFKGTQNALQLKQIAHGVRRGQKGRVKAGRIPGGNSYGYDIVRKFDEFGEPIKGLRKINEEQASVIQRIFNDYLLGKSARKIAEELNKEGVPSPRGGQWMASTINGNPARQNGILCNLLYTGKIVYNRQRFIKDPETGKRQARINPPEEWVIQEVPELRIIDDGIWEKVQSLKTAIAGRPKSQQVRKKHLFSGLIKCSECGGAYTVYGSGRYACSHHKERGTCSNGRTVKIKDLEDRILAALQDRMLTDEMLKEFCDGYEEELKNQRKDRIARRKSAIKELNQVSKEIDSIIRTIMDGLYTPSMKQTLPPLEERKAELSREIKELEEDNVITVKLNMANLYKKQIDSLLSRLNIDDRVKLEATNVLRSLVEEIIVNPSSEKGKYTLELKGDLATLLNFASGEEVLMPVVAGVGFGHAHQSIGVLVKNV